MANNMVQHGEELNEVNVIPLADLSLVLLIILMVISPLASQGVIQILNKQAQAATQEQDLTTPETPIIVSFEPGFLRLNGIEMNSDLDFARQLAMALGTHKDKTVMITAAPDMTHGKVVHVIDLTRRQGAENLVMLKWDPTRSPTRIAEITAPKGGH